jgi:hypothetical protein
MKKALASITVICYLAMSSGVIVNFHYCMNRLASAELFVSESKTCSKCGMHKHQAHDCCHDEIKVVKLQDDQNKAQVVSLLQPPVAAVNIPSSFILTSFYNADVSGHQHDHSPPVLPGQDVYLQNCVFRI